MRQNLALIREQIARSWRYSPLITSVTLACMLLNTVSFALVGLGLRAIVDGSVHDDTGAVAIGAIGAALAYSVEMIVSGIGFSLRIWLVERITLEQVLPEVLGDAAGIDTIAHLEHTDYLDRITVVRSDIWGVLDSTWSLIESAMFVLRLVFTLAVLGGVSPYLLGLLVFAAVPLLLERNGRRRIRDADLATAENHRLQKHLLELAVDAGSSKEIRLAGVGPELVGRQRAAWDSSLAIRYRAQLAAAAWSAAGWAIFGLGFVGALAMVVVTTAGTPSAAGNLVLAITVGSQLRSAVEMAVRRTTDSGGYARLLTPFLWLRRYAAAARRRSSGGRPAPTRLHEGIDLAGLTFRYPDATSPAVRDVTVRLPAGKVVAIVGEYGSGKTTLVKLLAKLYAPESGSILVDGVELAGIDTAEWRAGMAAAFQDFGRYQTTVAEAVGFGDVTAIDDPERIAAAVREADATTLVERLPDGVDTMLGRQFGGVELSEGQWQKVALARAGMRTAPVLFLLDEPTASLDAPSEHAIFARYMRQARQAARRTGMVTVVVSHRFSTVAGADLILVMVGGELVEHGDHETLLAAGGRYADLYNLQARAYAAGG
jgi:ATP-binding cassette subfamily B protein